MKTHDAPHARSPRRLVIAHWVDSLVTCLMAAFTARVALALFRFIFPQTATFLVHGLAQFGQVGVLAVSGGLVVVTGVLFPGAVTSARRGLLSLFALRFRHVGILLKVAFASFAYLLLAYLLARGSHSTLDLASAACLLLAVVVGEVLSWLLASFMVNSRSRPLGSRNTSGDTAQGTPSSDGRWDWLYDDVPIAEEAQSILPDHQELACRILARLFSPGKADAPAANLAVIGPYGSGKTSICNLVEDTYKRHRHENPDWPRVAFCRFEAWQYLTPEAAVQGLVSSITARILGTADAAELWALPERFLAVFSEAGGKWGKVLSSMLRGRSDPEHVLFRIRDVLRRFDMRVVVFVDDLDRIERTAPEAQLAITQALNQLQDVPGAQYIVAVGEMDYVPPAEQHTKPLYDLLKLTRFQELVPRFDAVKAMQIMRDLTEEALAEPEYYYPWAEPEGEANPLAWNEVFGFLSGPPFAATIRQFLDTPRTLKATLREADTAWKNGLKGEINWYDLIMASALKTAARDVFEWILRDRETFIGGPNPMQQLTGDTEASKARAEQLGKQLESLASRAGAGRQEAVIDAVKMLFPAFAARLPGQHVGREARAADQKIGSRPDMERSYLERFISGRLSDREVPDQPTLRFIRGAKQGQFDPHEFEIEYLETYEKQTGPLNKVVQFTELLTFDNALAIADVMLEWIAVPENASTWPAGVRDYFLRLTGDVHQILTRSGQGDPRARPDYAAREERIVAWLENKIEQFAGTAFAVPKELLGWFSAGTHGGWILKDDVMGGLRLLLAERLRTEFLEGDRPILDAVGPSRLLIGDLTRALGQHNQYEEFRADFSRKLVEQSEADESRLLMSRVITSLVRLGYPPGPGMEDSPEAYTSSVDKEQNSKTYDMDIVIPALRRWQNIALPDPVATGALKEVLGAYGLLEHNHEGGNATDSAAT